MIGREVSRGVVLGRPGPELLDRMLARADAGSLSYDRIASGGVGSTLAAGPAASGVHRETTDVGSGAAVFVAARDALRRWACHDGIGARIHPADTPLRTGTSLLVVLPAGPVSIVVPNRIVATVDEPRRFGFAYGTIEGHQERGEEAFVVEHGDDDVVRCTVSVDAVPGSLPARLVGPAVTRFSHTALRRYVRSWRDAVAAV